VQPLRRRRGRSVSNARRAGGEQCVTAEESSASDEWLRTVESAAAAADQRV